MVATASELPQPWDRIDFSRRERVMIEASGEGASANTGAPLLADRSRFILAVAPR
jgi:hypothetical protein